MILSATLHRGSDLGMLPIIGVHYLHYSWSAVTAVVWGLVAGPQLEVEQTMVLATFSLHF